MRDKQIKEMAKALIDAINAKHGHTSMRGLAESLYNAGYLKAEDVVREVFKDIENALFSSYYKDEIEDSILSFTLNKLNEAKHKYLNEDFFVKMTGFSEPPIPHTIESIADIAFPESEGEG
jgi:hypothetical protein